MSKVYEKQVNHEAIRLEPALPRSSFSRRLGYGATVAFICIGLLLANIPTWNESFLGDWLKNPWKEASSPAKESKVVRHYDLQIGTRWMNPGEN